MQKKTLNTSLTIMQADELDPVSSNLIDQAKKACLNAYAPYSKFNVGAAVLLQNGEIIHGSNQENAAYPSGLCAERVALFSANANYPHMPVISLAIVARNEDGWVSRPISPCGACRQVMLESEIRYKQVFSIYLYGESEIIKIEEANTLLPLSFMPDDLKL